MRRTTAIIVCSVAAAAAAAPAARAATLTADRACYPQGGAPAVLSGQGFAAGGAFAADLTPAAPGSTASGTADASGALQATLALPEPPTSGARADDAAYTATVRQGSTSASATFHVARVRGEFRPAAGDPRRLRVRFAAFGFGVATAAGEPMPRVYLHYVDARGKARRSVSLGRGDGPCGTIRRTAPRRLFPFTPRAGRWTLQFDTRRAYAHGTSSSPFPWDQIVLRISG